MTFPSPASRARVDHLQAPVLRVAVERTTRRLLAPRLAVAFG